MDEKPEEPQAEIDGQEHSWEFVVGCVRFALKYQLGTLDEILKDRGLLPVEGCLLHMSDGEEWIGDGWKMMGGQVLTSQHLVAGLQVPYTWLYKTDDDTARQLLREKMEQLGNAIWAARGK